MVASDCNWAGTRGTTVKVWFALMRFTLAARL